MRAWVVHEETLNIMKLAHQRFKDHVDMRGYPPNSMIEVGHGVWYALLHLMVLPTRYTNSDPRINRRPGDEAYDALLATDNVKVSVNMILDHNDEMDNP